MKKILLASSALVATAGVASADVNLSGLARFGILYTEAPAAGNPKTRIEQRFRLNIDASAEADGGLTFGARLRLQTDDTAAGGVGAAFIADPRFTVSAGGLTVGVGNINGAIASMPNLFAGSIGLSGLGWGNIVTNFAHDTYQSSVAARNGVELIYSMGDLGVHLSHSDVAAVAADTRTAIAVSYAVSGWTVALGYQDSDIAGDAEWTLTTGGALGSVNVSLNFAQTNTNLNSASLSGAFSVGAATTVTAYVAMDEAFKGVAGRDETTYGIGVVHNLGGGASIRGGVASNHGQTLADLGVQFNF